MVIDNKADNIILVGFMAVGKSTLGKLLAQRLGWIFLDTDQEIEGKTGLTIPEIFQRFGEARFRLEENMLVNSLKGASQTVIATGGGMIINPENFRILNNLGIMIHLDAPLELVLQRVKIEQERPLLNRSRDELEKLWCERRTVYRQADISLDTADKGIEETVDEILRLVKGDNTEHATEN